MIQEVILTAAGNNIKLAAGYLVMQPRAVDSRAIYKSPGFKYTLVCMDRPPALRGLDLLYFGFQHKLNAVGSSRVSQRMRQLIGTDQSGRRHIQRANHIGVEIGLHLQSLIPLNDAAACHAVDKRLFIELDDRFPVILAESKHHRAGLSVRNAQTAAQLRHHLSAFDIQPRLFRARLRVISRVDNAAVGLAGPLRHIVSPVQNGDFALIA